MEDLHQLPSHPYKLTEEELQELAKLGSPLIDSLARWLNTQLSCASCKKCTNRCEVLQSANLDMGMIEEALAHITSLPREERLEAIRDMALNQPEIYYALRRCCFCGYCTSECAVKMDAPFQMRDWRESLRRSDLIPPDDARLVMVDTTWHIFSAYRAIYEVEYPECTLLSDLVGTTGHAEDNADEYRESHDSSGAFLGTAAEEDHIRVSLEAPRGTDIDTLFFPGCSLVSYAPDVVKTVGAWLDEQGYSWALSLDCCGSPLVSAGLTKRSVALRRSILAQAKAAGIKRVITVCPGCGKELSEVFGSRADIVPLPELLLKEGKGFSKSVKTPTRVTVFDSCNDRYDLRHATALRTLLSGDYAAEPGAPQYLLCEMAHSGSNTLCCGAGGAVSSFDPDISERRVWRVHNEALESRADILATVCPTCTYTLAQAQLSGSGKISLPVRHYLELLFEVRIDWERVFTQLEEMWQGEYGPWLRETFYDVRT